MSRARVNLICAEFPGAERSDPWGGGHDAWKVAGKMFACVGAIQTGVSVKTDSVERAAMLIESGMAVRAPYFHASWVHLPADIADDELRHRLWQSYQLIRAGLPRKVQAALGPLEQG
jgi:predicted DNA-binding protein (MmcQ/YjbR family)